MIRSSSLSSLGARKFFAPFLFSPGLPMSKHTPAPFLLHILLLVSQTHVFDYSHLSLKILVSNAIVVQLLLHLTVPSHSLSLSLFSFFFWSFCDTYITLSLDVILFPVPCIFRRLSLSPWLLVRELRFYSTFNWMDRNDIGPRNAFIRVTMDTDLTFFLFFQRERKSLQDSFWRF